MSLTCYANTVQHWVRGQGKDEVRYVIDAGHARYLQYLYSCLSSPPPPSIGRWMSFRRRRRYRYAYLVLQGYTTEQNTTFAFVAPFVR